MKEIPLTQRKVALVDDEDYDKLSNFKWYAQKHKYTFYAVRFTYKNIRCIGMHVDILGQKWGDHIDGNGLNNQKNNLRKTTASQNQMNRFKRNNFSSIYKGVYWRNKRNKWQAQIRINSKEIYLGRFKSEIDAALAYNVKAKELFGKYARLNEVIYE